MRKSMGLFRLRPDRLVLWIMTGSNDCLVSTLKQRRSTPSPPLYGVVPPFFFNPLSKITSASSLLWNPLSITLGVFLNPHSLNHSLVSASLSITLPRCRHTVAAQPKFLPHSLKVSITLLSLPRSLVIVVLSQLSPYLFLTLSKSQSLSRLCLSPLSTSQLSTDRS